ncbi:MAG TPA: branched-chain amino acid aminotransferase [Candidatus Sulfotelmatobacter sp.]|nr:branched-chain amino acid aminotransferase [Candidatus Sulfotelmatobacter sp.]
MMDLRITKTTHPRPRVPDADLGFGQILTDHMLAVDYTHGKGWHDARIVPYGPFSMDPAAVVLHYGQAVFDGLKAFRNAKKGVVLFRPDRHIARLNRSSARVCIPPLDEGFALRCLKELVRLEADWVPRTAGCSLYVRPTIIATEAALGVHPSRNYIYFVILSPVGAYYKEGFNPVKIIVEEQYGRAAKGGTGAAKTPGNYAASLLAAEGAHAKGFTQVLWLDAAEHRYVEEVGTMNILFRIGDELVTPPLEGTILGGITRESVLHLAREWRLRVAERPITIDEVAEAHAAGRLREVFGSGTAAVISPVGELHYKGQRMVINGGGVGEWTKRFFDTIVGIQYGTLDDPYGWTVPVGA